MQLKRDFRILCGALCFILLSSAVFPLHAQQTTAPANSAAPQTQSDPLASLSPEDRALFETLRNAARQNDDATTLSAGKKLLPALQPGTPLSDFVTQLVAGSALETGDSAYTLTLLKPFTDAHPDDWRAAALLARAYAEHGDKSARDQQIAHMQDLHKKTTDPNFAKLHTFPIQKVALHSGYAVFLYPFQPLGRHNTYLVALIYTADGKSDYRIELESDDVDQAFFKPKHPGERRFSIDTFHESQENGNFSESQALHGFVDGKFDYDTMRDHMVQAANGGETPAK